MSPAETGVSVLKVKENLAPAGSMSAPGGPRDRTPEDVIFGCAEWGQKHVPGPQAPGSAFLPGISRLHLVAR